MVADGSGGQGESARGAKGARSATGARSAEEGLALVVLVLLHVRCAESRRSDRLAALHGTRRPGGCNNCRRTGFEGFRILRSDSTISRRGRAERGRGVWPVHAKEFVRYLRIALSSIVETETHLERGRRRKYFSDGDHLKAVTLSRRARFMTTRLLQAKLRQIEAENNRKTGRQPR